VIVIGTGAGGGTLAHRLAPSWLVGFLLLLGARLRAARGSGRGFFYPGGELGGGDASWLSRTNVSMRTHAGSGRNRLDRPDGSRGRMGSVGPVSRGWHGRVLA
jgi:hypothetical protein